jgi:hypothetical protein
MNIPCPYAPAPARAARRLPGRGCRRALVLASLLFLLWPALPARAQCVEGDCVNGTGVKITRGHKYSGEFKNNHRNGQGMYEYPNGDRYEGRFVDGIISGEGIYFYKNGDRYEGHFENNARNGVGTYYTADDHAFSGVWKDGILVERGAEVVSEDLLEDEVDADKLLREVRQQAATPPAGAEQETPGEEELDRMVDELLKD